MAGTIIAKPNGTLAPTQTTDTEFGRRMAEIPVQPGQRAIAYQNGKFVEIDEPTPTWVYALGAAAVGLAAWLLWNK